MGFSLLGPCSEEATFVDSLPRTMDSIHPTVECHSKTQRNISVKGLEINLPNEDQPRCLTIEPEEIATLKSAQPDEGDPHAANAKPSTDKLLIVEKTPGSDGFWHSSFAGLGD